VPPLIFIYMHIYNSIFTPNSSYFLLFFR